VYLASLTVENYRGVRRGRLDFDPTTVVIGENDCGKSSLLEALAMALDPEAGEEPPRFRPWHFHRAAPRADAPHVGPMRLSLQFRERKSGEWDSLASTPLGGLLRPAAQGLRAMALEIRAVPAPDQHETVAEWRLRAMGAARGTALTSPAALAFLRRLNPLIWLHGGGLVGVSALRREKRPRPVPDSPEITRLASRILDRHAELVSGTTPDVQAALGEGFAAARDFIALAAHHLGGQRHNFREMVAEILDQRQRLADDADTAAGLSLTGSGAERIGVLALLAALLGAIPEQLAAGAEPLWIIEDPEAQLHPMTLASVLTLVDRFNWQKIITTQSPQVLASEPLTAVRRLTRKAGEVQTDRVRPNRLSAEDLRRVSYHLRARHGLANFARCWLLVEGETEFWIMPELARIAGHDFAIEGIACVEFAQCGLPPLVKLARELGIEWHLLTDGDAAGDSYAQQALRFVRDEPAERRLTVLPQRDIETCFYEHGYESLFRRLAKVREGHPPERIVRLAIERHSKPKLALELVLATAAAGSTGPPPPLLEAVEASVTLARGSVSEVFE